MSPQRTPPTSFPHSYLNSIPPERQQSLPYPPDIFPNGCFVPTPYGDVRAYYFGPKDFPDDDPRLSAHGGGGAGETVVLVHGMTNPCVALRDLSFGLVSNGYRVLIFGNPNPHPNPNPHTPTLTITPHTPHPTSHTPPNLITN